MFCALARSCPSPVLQGEFMATFRKRGDKWQARVQRSGQGPISKSFNTKPDAVKWARNIESQLDLGTFAPKQTMPRLMPLMARYVDEVTPTKKGDSQERYRAHCKSYLERLIAISSDLRGKTLEQVLLEKHELRVFRPRDGVQPTHLIAQFKQFLEDIGMLKCPTTGEARTLYSLRHFAITQMITKGFTAEQIQTQVRTSATMIAKYYKGVKTRRSNSNSILHSCKLISHDS